MFTTRRTRTALSGGLALVAAIALTGCGTSGNPLDEPTDDTAADRGGNTIVVGSQAYYSNEIIAEIYAQALENAGFTVERQFSIGQRDAYMPEIESGTITLFPEYTGNLLEYLDEDATATSPDDVYAALQDVLPEGLTALDYAEASDQDTYTVLKSFAALVKVMLFAAPAARVVRPAAVRAPVCVIGPVAVMASVPVEVVPALALTLPIVTGPVSAQAMLPPVKVT